MRPTQPPPPWRRSTARRAVDRRPTTGQPSRSGCCGWLAAVRSRPAPRRANQLRDLIVTAPGPLRERLARLSTNERVAIAARFRPGQLTDPTEAAKAAMATIARRHQTLTAEIDQLDARLGALVEHAAPPQFLAKQGVATQVASALLITVGDNPTRLDSEAGFAALCGASPVE